MPNTNRNDEHEVSVSDGIQSSAVRSTKCSIPFCGIICFTSIPRQLIFHLGRQNCFHAFNRNGQISYIYFAILTPRTGEPYQGNRRTRLNNAIPTPVRRATLWTCVSNLFNFQRTSNNNNCQLLEYNDNKMPSAPIFLSPAQSNSLTERNLPLPTT